MTNGIETALTNVRLSGGRVTNAKRAVLEELHRGERDERQHRRKQELRRWARQRQFLQPEPRLDDRPADRERAEVREVALAPVHRAKHEHEAAQQQQRLSELMARWRAARDAGSALPPAQQAELDALVAAEVRASGQRAAAALADLGK